MTQIATMSDLFSLLARGARIVQRRRARWPGDPPKDRYHIQHGAESIAVPQGLAIAAIRTTKLTNIPGTEHGPEWALPSHQHNEDPMNAVAAHDTAPAPRRFTKIGVGGCELPDDAPAWEAVRDNVTGLMWTAEHKRVDHWKKAAGAAKRFKTAGFTDWRLPTVEELFLLADRSRVRPAIDVTYFPTCESDWYWTSTVYASSPGGFAWGVSFGYGDALWGYRGNDGFVRAVRASQ